MTRNKRAWCSFITVLSPMLMMYNIGISTLTLLDGILLLTYLWFIVADFDKLSISLGICNKVLFVFISIVIFSSVLFFTLGIIDKTVILRTCRLLLYLSWSLIIGYKYFDRDMALRLYKWFCMFATVFLIAQYILLFFFEYKLPGYIRFLPLSRPEVEVFTMGMNASITTRPRSVFGEPSQYGIYITGYLSIMFLTDRLEFDKKALIFLCAGMLLSRSTTAIFGVGLSLLLIMCFWLKEGRRHFTKKSILFGGLAFLAIFAVAVINISRIVRLVTSFLARLPASIEHRIEGYLWLGEWISCAVASEIIFGIGMNEEAIYKAGTISWVPSTVKIIVYFGILGIVVMLCLMFVLNQRVEKECRGFIWIILIMGCFTELLVSNWLVLFLPFLYYQGRIAGDGRKLGMRKGHHFPRIIIKSGG